MAEDAAGVLGTHVADPQRQRELAEERRLAAFNVQCSRFDNNCGSVHPSNCPDCPHRAAGVKTVDGGQA